MFPTAFCDKNLSKVMVSQFFSIAAVLSEIAGGSNAVTLLLSFWHCPLNFVQ